jgi:hypothetical protein
VELLNDQATFRGAVWAVEKELFRADGFFRDSRVILHFGSRLLNKEEWRDHKELFPLTDKSKIAFPGQTRGWELRAFLLRRADEKEAVGRG